MKKGLTFRTTRETVFTVEVVDARGWFDEMMTLVIELNRQPSGNSDRVEIFQLTREELHNLHWVLDKALREM